MDVQQDWNLGEGREENGWTIMSFNRTLQTGDNRDRDIVQVSTVHQGINFQLYAIQLGSVAMELTNEIVLFGDQVKNRK